MSHNNAVEYGERSRRNFLKVGSFFPNLLKSRSRNSSTNSTPRVITEDDGHEDEIDGDDEDGEISMEELEEMGEGIDVGVDEDDEDDEEEEEEIGHRIMEEEIRIGEDEDSSSSNFRREDIELEEISLVTGEKSGFLKKAKMRLKRGKQFNRDLIRPGLRHLRKRVRRRRAQVYTDRYVQSQPVYDYFWSQNLERETKWYEDCYGICFPCCVGNPCSKVRLKDYFRLVTSFILWVSIAEIIYLCVEIGFGVHPLSMFYHPNPTRLSLILIRLGGKYTYGIKVKYQIYRLVTAIFMHSDLVHLIFNLLVQFSLALGYEKNWKITRMAFIYIVSGAAGNMLSSVIYPSVITVGASGSLLGVILAKLANVICRWTQFTMNERFIHVCSIAFIVTITGIMSFSPTVDWGSHLGGGVMGFILGMGLFCQHIPRKEIRIAVLLMALFACLFFFLSVIIIFVFYTQVESFE